MAMRWDVKPSPVKKRLRSWDSVKEGGTQVLDGAVLFAKGMWKLIAFSFLVAWDSFRDFWNEKKPKKVKATTNSWSK